ncbi:hypothetical protein ACIBL6_29130 [Streptomyces sp. NPDC050400]|uniref:hypothetical protein n=1 Tax=Streptomyces sp. NPDC050400 TaxID=3365610 RepID=UPI0037AC3594
MQENGGQSVLPAHERAQALLRAGELGPARAEARAALEAHGPHAGLSLVLGRAHAAEDDDDHDLEAERVYRAGLDAFPDDLDLLAAYAEFGLAGDPMEQPGRVARGRRAADRVRELAPDSPQALRRGEPADRYGTRRASENRVQRHDARTALNSGVDLRVAAAQAEETALAWPNDRRLQTRAETLAALVSDGLTCLTLRRPYGTALVLGLLAGGWLLAVPALGLSWPHSLWALTALVPVLRERKVLRDARGRAELRLPLGYGIPAPGSPDVPLRTRREQAALALALTVVAGALCGSAGWQYERWADYPRYAAAAPKSFHGMSLTDAGGMGEQLNSSLAQTVPADDAEPFSAVYKDEKTGALIVLAGATGDLHDQVPEDMAEEMRDGFGSAGMTVKDTWSADPGEFGGELGCGAYSASGAEISMCAWADKGSMGMVMVSGDDDRAGIVRTTRELREATLRPTTEGAA